MKKILGLDLGVSSIGWALVNEAENKDEKSSVLDDLKSNTVKSNSCSNKADKEVEYER